MTIRSTRYYKKEREAKTLKAENKELKEWMRALVKELDTLTYENSILRRALYTACNEDMNLYASSISCCEDVADPGEFAYDYKGPKIE